MASWRRWVRPGIAVAFLLAAVAVAVRLSAIEADLGTRVRAQLAADGQEWATVEVSGRRITIRGTAPSPESQGSAVLAAAQVPGVAGAANASDLLAVATPYVWIAKRSGKVVTLSGNVPSESARNAVLAGARRALPDAEIRDDMTLARGAAANFNSTTAFALDRLEDLTDGVITVTDGIVSVSGVAASSTSYAEARGAFLEQTPEAVTLGPVEVLPARADPFVWSAKYDGSSVQLAGYVPNEVVHETLAAAAGGIFGQAPITDEMRVASGEPEGFTEAATFALGALGRLREGEVSLSGLTLQLSGTARSVDDYEAVMRGASRDLPEGLIVASSSVRPATVSPYGWSGSRTGDAVRIVGYVPSIDGQEELRELSAALFAGLQVTDGVRVAVGEPKMDWLGAVKFAMAQLAKLQTGSVTLGDRVITIDGDAASGEAFESLMAISDRTLPASLKLTDSDIRPPRVSPYVFTAARAPAQLTLTGYVPADADRKALLETARRKFGTVEIVDKLSYASGAPPDFQEAAAAALQAVARLAGGRAEIVDASIRVDGGVYSAHAVDEIIAGTTEALPKAFRPDISVVTRQPGQPFGAVECRDHLASELQTGRIEFEGTKAEVSHDSYGLLDRVAATLVRCPEANVEVAAHSDGDGSAARNRDLTQARAEAIVDYLVDSGVERERLRAVGYGEEKPVAGNETAEGKAANRRIEFTVGLPEGGG